LAFKVTLTDTAHRQLRDLEFDDDRKDPVRLKKVRKCLGYLQTNPKHPSLQTHEYSSMKGENGEKVWEAYAENKTSSAWRVFWHYGPDSNEITIVAVTPHP
jgi:hypothetical protein